jgi:hypothetical protein
MKREWLQKKLETNDYVTLVSEEIKLFGLSEKDEREALEFLAKTLPHKRWEEFIRAMEPGDELWHYKSPKETWNSLCGRAGYAIVRKGEIVSFWNTVVS